MDMALAAVVPLSFGSAYAALHDFGQVRPGMQVLVHGAATGVGLAAIQLAAEAGAIVSGTAWSEDRLARIRPFGLHHCVELRSNDLATRLRDVTGGEGFDLVVDAGSGAAKPAIVEAMRPGSRYAIAGLSKRDLPSFHFLELVMSGLTVSGICIGHTMHTPPVRTRIAHLLERVASGELHMPVEHEFALCEVVDAHHFMLNGHPFGRAVMRP
jgi:NADPH:quinone reductase-like Zn-dependent oxidoreductase